MTWESDPEGRMLALILGLAFAVLVLFVCSAVMTSVVAFTLVIALLLVFVGALVFVP